MADIVPDLSEPRRALLDQILASGVDAPAAIGKRPDHVRVPLTEAQRRIWFHTELHPESPEYNIPLGVRITGPFNRSAFSAALNEICDHHEILRARIMSVAGEPVQVFAEKSEIDMDFHDLAHLPRAAVERRTAELADRIAAKPFRLDRDPLLRAAVIRVAPDDHVLLTVVQHILLDGWSAALFVRDLCACYNTVVAGRRPVLDDLPVQYGDYAVWATEEQEPADRELEYWRGQLRGVQPLELPTDTPRPARRSGRGGKVRFEIPAPLPHALRELCRRYDATPFMAFLAAFQALLSRYTGQQDIAVGTLVSSRNRPELENVLGLFMNTVVLRGDVSGDPRFAEFLGRTREVTLAALAHQDLPFDRVVEDLQPERDLGRTPLFQAFFELYQDVAQTWELAGVVASAYPVSNSTEKFDLTISLTDERDRVSGQFSYNTDVFEIRTVERLVEHFLNLLRAIITDPEVRISEIDLLGDVQRQQIISAGHGPVAEYPRDRCFHELFEDQVNRTPDATAVVFGEQVVTYQELNARANQLAHELRSWGVGPETVVGICVEHRPEMLIGLLAILKAGGAYLPLDPDHPAERQAFMLHDTRTTIILTQHNLVERLPRTTARLFRLDQDWPTIITRPTSNPSPLASPDNLVYIIYTSGSTGRPKGVMVDHHGLNNYLTWATTGYGLTGEQGAAMLGSIAFDLSIPNLFLPLLGGRDVTFLPHDKTLQHLAHLLQQPHDFSLLKITPSHLDALRALLPTGTRLDSVRTYVVGADEVKAETVVAWRNIAPNARIIDEYGPTETVVGCSVYLVPEDQDTSRPVSIGKPIANTQMYVLDQHLQPVPIGVIGELYIGGDGVTRGYLNRPHHTAEKFLPNPYPTHPGERLYRTGDLARLHPDGNLEFLGRIDNQVKIRGHRIELGEIEAHLLTHPHITETIVTVHEHNGDKQLAAYLVPTNSPPTVDEVRQHLTRTLPSYMIPTSYTYLATLPLSPGGKVDRRLLPAPTGQSHESQHTYQPPRTPTEVRLCDIITRTLHIDHIGIHDNFFDLGGHSLTAIKAVGRIREELDVELDVRDLFESPTVAGIAGLMRRTPSSYPSITRRPPHSRPLASHAQTRLWLQDQQSKVSDYHVPVVLRLRGPIDRYALGQALTALVDRHEVLRTSFTFADGEVLQVIAPPGRGFPLDVHDRTERPAEELVARTIDAPVDLATDPPLRCSLIRLAEHDHLLPIVFHHIAVDDVSTDIFVRELVELYRAFSQEAEAALAPLPVQYADYGLWQRNWLQGERSASLLEYWREQLRGVPPLELPTDTPRPARRSGRGGIHRFVIPAELADALKHLGRHVGATPFVVVQAAFVALLSRYSGQDDIAVGTPVSERNRPEVDGVIGPFFNVLVLRGNLSGDPRFAEFLGRTREVTLAALAHQDLPFERLVEDLQPDRDPSRTPLFQVLFQYDVTPDDTWRRLVPDLSVERVPRDAVKAKYDLSLIITDHGDGPLGAEIEYSADLFTAATVGRLAGHFLNLVGAVVRDPEVRISEVELLGDVERREILTVGRGPVTTYPRDRCFHELFEDQVNRTPNATAVVFGEQRLTYRELNTRANQLAHELRSWGVGPETVVGICVEHRPEMLIGLLAILKAGGAYLPLDPDHPAERQAFMLHDTRTAIILTQRDLLARLPETTARLFFLDEDWPTEQPTSNPSPLAGPDNLVYIIYTSGSTGRPKGVMVDHHGLNNYLTWATTGYGLTGEQGAAMLGSIAFDLSIPNLFLPLLGGRDVTFLPHDKTLQHLANLLQQPHDFSLLKITPSHLDALRALLPEHTRLDSVRTYVVGADEVKAETVLAWRNIAPNARIIDEYGPTETVVGCSTYLIPEDQDTNRPVSIGKPIANTQMYVLDQHLQPVPTGVIGELYIGGDGVTRGYLNRPHHTAEKFLPDPHSHQPGARLYRTGDLTRLHPNGNLEFLGRTDHQVKIRGHRIELGEIEAHLLTHPHITETIVTVHHHNDDKQLAAYLVPDHEPPTTTELRQHLAQTLPPYMIPTSYTHLTTLPLSPGGKVDRRLLPAPTTQRTEPHTYQPPRTPTEAQLCEIITRTLHIDHIGIHDNFFDLGGHSLATIQAARFAADAGLHIEPADIYERPTVVALAIALADRQRDGGATGPADRPGQFTSLVRLKPDGSRRPLFCVHPSGGSVAWYLGLCQATDADQPVLAFQPAGMARGHRPHDSIEDMAAHYVSEMRTWQPDGPYALLGWSFGGVIAYEMARQLGVAGEVVDPLLLVEPSLPGDQAQMAKDHRHIALLRRGAALMSLVLGGGVDRAGARADLDRWLDEMGWAKSSVSPETVPALHAAAAMLVGYRNYEARPYPGSIQLIASDECLDSSEQRPSQISGTSFPDYLAQWQALADGPVTVHRSAREHATMFVGQNVKDVGDLCGRLIQAADKRLTA
ncbi:amino acid adenylation domain-containing protein [Actinocrispum wychmicini]|uniref:Amino acid adenylation domain-containing protein n=1 Tax=Actinocrispum wychmicini TaxID=1213861 RepID=A0A4R2J711_9PSEU|nr:non-ribosomal peptide synthetase [Actinocrispum wychmicini]TCO54853.1 amino acid adenylation domain-containing protein [Actinocrispum wychmicini]